MSPYIYCTEFISEMQFCFLFFKFTVKLIAHSLKWKIPCSTLIFGLPLPFSPHIDRKNTPAGPNKYEKANGVLHMRKGNGKKNECLYWHIQRAEELIKLIICLIFFKKKQKTNRNKQNKLCNQWGFWLCVFFKRNIENNPLLQDLQDIPQAEHFYPVRNNANARCKCLSAASYLFILSEEKW